LCALSKAAAAIFPRATAAWCSDLVRPRMPAGLRCAGHQEKRKHGTGWQSIATGASARGKNARSEIVLMRGLGTHCRVHVPAGAASRLPRRITPARPNYFSCSTIIVPLIRDITQGPSPADQMHTRIARGYSPSLVRPRPIVLNALTLPMNMVVRRNVITRQPLAG